MASRALRDRLARKVAKAGSSECWLWTGHTDGSGYGLLRVGRLRKRAHRIAYELFVGPIPDGLQVLHRCDTPACTNPAHLFLGTARDNIADKVAKGRQARGPAMGRQGSRHHNARLNAAQVASIRASVQDGRTQRVIAAEFGISQTTVSQIINHKRWKEQSHGKRE
jgi:hypothetical protein